MSYLKQISVLFLIGLLSFSCQKEKEYQALDGNYVDILTLQKLKDRTGLVANSPTLYTRFSFTKDTATYYMFGWEKDICSYTKKGTIYSLKSFVYPKTNFDLEITSDSTFSLNDKKGTHRFQKITNANFQQCLNELAIAGTYEITFPNLLAGKKITFANDGTVVGFEKSKTYNIPFASGDGGESLYTKSGSGKNSIFCNKALYAWEYNSNKKDITLYNTYIRLEDSDGNALKNDVTILDKAYQLKRIGN